MDKTVNWGLVGVVLQKLGLIGTDDSVGFSIVLLVGVLLCAAVGYFVGSFSPAIFFSRHFFRQDIRTLGSGNAGTTNMLRNYGTRFAVVTMLIDMLKAAAATLLGLLLFARHGAAIAGFFAIFGHMFPIYYRFKGGKGVACTAAVALVLSPPTFAVMLFCFVVIVALTKYVSLASVMCAFLYPLLLDAFAPGDSTAVLMGILTTVFVVFMHRGNLKRLYNGEESKFSFRHKENDGSDAREKKKK